MLSCPYALIIRSPAVHVVRSHYFWRECGSLNRPELSIPLVDAIDAFAAGVSEATREQLDKAKKGNR